MKVIGWLNEEVTRLQLSNAMGFGVTSDMNMNFNEADMNIPQFPNLSIGQNYMESTTDINKLLEVQERMKTPAAAFKKSPDSVVFTESASPSHYFPSYSMDKRQQAQTHHHHKHHHQSLWENSPSLDMNMLPSSTGTTNDQHFKYEWQRPEFGMTSHTK